MNNLMNKLDGKDVLIAMFAIGTVYGGYLAGQQAMSEKIIGLESRVNDKSRVLGEMSQRIEMLCEADPRCASRYPPIKND